MSFNDLANKEAAAKKAAQEQDPKPPTRTEASRASAEASSGTAPD